MLPMPIPSSDIFRPWSITFPEKPDAKSHNTSLVYKQETAIHRWQRSFPTPTTNESREEGDTQSERRQMLCNRKNETLDDSFIYPSQNAVMMKG